MKSKREIPADLSMKASDFDAMMRQALQAAPMSDADIKKKVQKPKKAAKKH